MTLARRSLLGILLGGGAVALPAQSGIRTDAGAELTLTATHANPIPRGGGLTEVRVLSPMLTGALTLGHRHTLRVEAAINLERWTIPDGHLSLGTWGEGLVDRRHPHTTFHELLVTGQTTLGATRLGLVLGKGFVPFGTDDPMHRPFAAFPVNHHWAQVLERAVVIGQLRRGRLAVEGALFNGDEPEHPAQWPLLRTPDGHWRFGDSRAGRLTWWPGHGMEIQGSLASVRSPEHRPGAGGPSRKASLSTRWERPRHYLLAEWARTTELEGIFAFHSVLVEGAVQRGTLGVAYRFESTERPEEERLENPFQTPRPHHGDALLGITRWQLHTLRVEHAARAHGLEARPFAELTMGRVRKVGGGIVDPDFLYAGGAIRQLSLGLVIRAGGGSHRMGRYGVLHDPATAHGQHPGHPVMLEGHYTSPVPTDRAARSSLPLVDPLTSRLPGVP